jgi:hypothetical protein
MNSPQGEVARGSINGLAKFGLVGGALVIGYGALKGFGVDLPFPNFDGGEPDPAPEGQVYYEGQDAKTVTEEFVMPIGNGTARVSIEANQNWDRHGTAWNGDWQSTNGHAEVSNPDDRDEPALLEVEMEYAADGVITVTPEVDPENGEVLADEATGEPVVGQVTYEMGNLWVIDADYEESAANEAAFLQDDTPADFQGEFESFIKRAAEDVALASDSSEALAEYQEPAVIQDVRTRLADRFDVPVERVEVVAGEIGVSSDETQEDLRDRLDSYANKRDPRTDETYESLDIAYLGGQGTAVEDANFLEVGRRDLEDLAEVEAPDLTPDETPETTSAPSRIPQ